MSDLELEVCPACSDFLAGSVWVGDLKSCPNCSRERGQHVYYKQEHFGLRGTQIQSWCRACRGEGVPPKTELLCKAINAGDFGWALGELRAGRKLRRRNWNGEGMHIALQRPDDNSANTLPYIYIITVHGDRVPWVASQTDLLVADWELA